MICKTSTTSTPNKKQSKRLLLPSKLFLADIILPAAAGIPGKTDRLGGIMPKEEPIDFSVGSPPSSLFSATARIESDDAKHGILFYVPQ